VGQEEVDKFLLTISSVKVILVILTKTVFC